MPSNLENCQNVILGLLQKGGLAAKTQLGHYHCYNNSPTSKNIYIYIYMYVGAPAPRDVIRGAEMFRAKEWAANN